MTESKNPMEILYDADLSAEFGMKKNFIDRHSREMGSRGRPRTFLRVNVEKFVLVYYNDQLMEDLAKKAEALRVEEVFQNIKRTVFSNPVVSGGPRKMILRGGRVRKGSGRGLIDEGRLTMDEKKGAEAC